MLDSTHYRPARGFGIFDYKIQSTTTYRLNDLTNNSSVCFVLIPQFAIRIGRFVFKRFQFRTPHSEFRIGMGQLSCECHRSLCLIMAEGIREPLNLILVLDFKPFPLIHNRTLIACEVLIPQLLQYLLRNTSIP